MKSPRMAWQRRCSSKKNSEPERKKRKTNPLEGVGLDITCLRNDLPRWKVGVDPGKKNVITCMDAKGRYLRYSSRQRMFESKLSRYRQVLEREKQTHGISEAEIHFQNTATALSIPSPTCNTYSSEKRVDSETNSFYLLEKWRNWKFRIYCNKKSSEDRLCNRIGNTFGHNCELFYSRKTLTRGCPPSPNAGMRLLLKRRGFVLYWIQDFKDV